MEFLLGLLTLLRLFFSYKWFRVVLDEKSLQGYSANAGVPWESIPGLLMTFLMMLSVILLSILMILLSTLSVIWQQPKLDSELESNLDETVDWGRKWLDFNAGKTQLVLFGRSNFPGASVQFSATKSSVI